jgi:phosphatidylinositol glycan class A protein
VITISHPPDRLARPWSERLPHPSRNYRILSDAPRVSHVLALILRHRSPRAHSQHTRARREPLVARSLEDIFHADFFVIRIVFTDHNRFDFDDAARILTSKLLEAALRNVDAVICVSHTRCVLGHAGAMSFRLGLTWWSTLSGKTPLFVPNFVLAVHIIPHALVADYLVLAR